MRRTLITCLFVVVAGCSSTTNQQGADDSSVTTSSTVDPTSTSLVSAAASTQSPTLTTSPTATTRPATPTTRPPTPTTKKTVVATTAPAGPVAVNFSAYVVSSCGIPPAPDASFVPPPTTPPTVRIVWKFTGADSVYVAIDNVDGGYQYNLPVDGNIDLPLSCPGQHTYYVVAERNGVRNVQSQVLP